MQFLRAEAQFFLAFFVGAGSGLGLCRKWSAGIMASARDESARDTGVVARGQVS